MKPFYFFFLLLFTSAFVVAQSPSPNQMQARLPKGTIIQENIPYNSDTLKKHLLDIYLTATAKGKLPLVVFIHGGGWISNDKYADMGYMPQTLNALLDNGRPGQSRDYQWSRIAL